MDQQVVSTEWPYNLMVKLLGKEVYQKWETHIPESFYATLDYYLSTAFSERDEGIIRKHYQEHRKIREIAECYGLSTQSIQNILKDSLRRMAQTDHRTFLLLGMPAFLNEQKQIAYAKGYRRGLEHGSQIWSFDLVHHVGKVNDYMIDLPGHDQMINKIRFRSNRASDMLRAAGIHTVNQLMDTSVEELQEKVGLGKIAIEDINSYLRRTGRLELVSEAAPKPEQPDVTSWPWNLIHEMFSATDWNSYIQYLPDEAEESFFLIYRICWTPEEQRLLELRFKDNIPYAQIDKMLNEKPGFAYRRIKICLRKLRHPSRYGIVKYGLRRHFQHQLWAASTRGYREGFDKGVDIREMEYGYDGEV